MTEYPAIFTSHRLLLDGRTSSGEDHGRRLVEWVRTRMERTDPRMHGTDDEHWRGRLIELARKYDVPGAALGILRLRPDGTEDTVEAAHGVLSRATEVEATTTSSFQIGSITKVYTAALIMQLIDEGRAGLDTPVAEVLPDLRLKSARTEDPVTIGHVLAHTSGIPGDLFEDTGRGDDCVQKYVASLNDHALEHPPGAIFSYSNGGYVVAGRIIEALTGLIWDEALRERLVEPLGLRHTTTLPEEAILGRAAVGHLSSPDGPRPTPLWSLPRSVGPGGCISSTAGDVLAFARMHLTGGRSRAGAAVISPASVALMQQKHAEVPRSSLLCDSWGLGWMRARWQERDLIGHDGGTIGQTAFLRILVPEGLAVVLLTNGGRAVRLFQDLFGEIFSDLADLRMPPWPVPGTSSPPGGSSGRAGTYERTSERAEITEGDDGRLLLRVVTDAALAAKLGSPAVREHELRPGSGENVFLLWAPDPQVWVPVSFVQGSDGTRYFHSGLRANVRIG